MNSKCTLCVRLWSRERFYRFEARFLHLNQHENVGQNCQYPGENLGSPSNCRSVSPSGKFPTPKLPLRMLRREAYYATMTEYVCCNLRCISIILAFISALVVWEMTQTYIRTYRRYRRYQLSLRFPCWSCDSDLPCWIINMFMAHVSRKQLRVIRRLRTFVYLLNLWVCRDDAVDMPNGSDESGVWVLPFFL